MKWFILFLVLTSCSANYHLNKAVKKGAQLEQISVPIYLYDTIIDTVENKVIIRTLLKDTIYQEKTLVKYVPKTRYQTRIEYKYDYKRFKDSLRHYRVIYSDSLRNALKTSKIENRTERKKSNRFNRIFWWGMIFFIFILFLYIVGRIVASKLLK